MSLLNTTRVSDTITHLRLLNYSNRQFGYHLASQSVLITSAIAYSLNLETFYLGTNFSQF